MECGGPLCGPHWLAGMVDGGPERGRNVYDKFPGPLRQQQARSGGQQAGSWPSFSALGCWCVVADVNSALRRFAPVGKARAGSALAGQVVGPLAGRRLLDT
jgi:hypothetical protein